MTSISYPASSPRYLLLAALALGCGLSEIPVNREPGVIAGSGGVAGSGGAGGTGPSIGRAGGSSGQGGGMAGVGGSAADAATMTPGPPTGAGVVIAGQAVPRDRALVFLHIGHSNMAGRSETPESERPYFYDTHPRLWAYAKGNVWRPASEPLSGDSMNRGRAGPGMAILRAALARAPDTFAISIGRGQSGQSAGYCRSFRRGGLLYPYVMDPARELRGRVTFAGVFVMFGISEVEDRSNAATFAACAQAVVREMREDLGEPELPFAFGDWEDGVKTSVGRDSSIAGIIMPQLRALPGQMPRVVLIDTVGLPIEEGDHHYTLIGQKLWAERGIDLLVKGGLAPWAAQALISARAPGSYVAPFGVVILLRRPVAHQAV